MKITPFQRPFNCAPAFLAEQGTHKFLADTRISAIAKVLKAIDQAACQHVFNVKADNRFKKCVKCSLIKKDNNV